MSKQMIHPPVYRIKTVASMTGLTTHLIRKWEERYHLVAPQRSPNGYRVFRENDIQFLLYLKSQLTNGESIGQLAQIGEPHLRQAMKKTAEDLSSLPPQFHAESRKILQSSQKQDYGGIQRTIEQWIFELGLEKAIDVILFPLLRLFGELWHRGGISHSAENCVSQIIRQQLIQHFRQDFAKGQKQALIACMPREFHEIGPLTATLLLQKQGWHATYLGPNVSFDVLQIALRRRHADLMILSSTTELDFQTGQSWIAAMALRFQPHCQVLAGGAGFQAFSDYLHRKGIPYVPHVQEIRTLDPKTSSSYQMPRMELSSY